MYKCYSQNCSKEVERENALCPECKRIYWGTKRNGSIRRNWTLEEMQKRLREMQQEAREKEEAKKLGDQQLFQDVKQVFTS
jgi:hypothetical protein